MTSQTAGPRFYGRRKGRPLRSGMQSLLVEMLPKLRFDIERPVSGQFDQNADLALEIGFGSGEHLAGLAKAMPKTNFIGAEPFVNGVASLLRHIFICKLDNIRIWDDDVRLILSALPEAGLTSVFIMFPDPWPKKRHARRRILQPEMMEMLSHLIRPGGQLVLASDDPTAKNWLLRNVIEHLGFRWTALGPSDWRLRPPQIPETRYMKKAEQANRQPAWFVFERMGQDDH